MVEDLEDLFSTPGTRDDKTLSTEGVEELFDSPAEEMVDDGLTLAPLDAAADSTASGPSAPQGPIHDLLASLADDLKKLADDIHKLLED